MRSSVLIADVLFGRLAGTVQLMKAKPTLLRAHNAEGWRWRIEFTFAYSAMGWNWLFFPDPSGVNGGWYNVNNKEYQEADVLDDHRSLTPGARDLNMLLKVAT